MMATAYRVPASAPSVLARIIALFVTRTQFQTQKIPNGVFAITIKIGQLMRLGYFLACVKLGL